MKFQKKKFAPAKKLLTHLFHSVIMIVFQCAIGSIRKGRVCTEKLRFRPLFMRPNANRLVFAGRFSGKPQGNRLKGLKLPWLPQAMLTSAIQPPLERGVRRTGCPLSGGLAVMTDCGLGHGGNGCTQGVIMTLPAGSLAPAGGGWNEDRKVIGTVTNR